MHDPVAGMFDGFALGNLRPGQLIQLADAGDLADPLQERGAVLLRP